MIITIELKNKIKKQYEKMCYLMDDINNKYDLYEIYDGFSLEDNPDYFKTHKTTKQKMDILKKKLNIIIKFARENNINLWEGLN